MWMTLVKFPFKGSWEDGAALFIYGLGSRIVEEGKKIKAGDVGRTWGSGSLYNEGGFWIF